MTTERDIQPYKAAVLDILLAACESHEKLTLLVTQLNEQLPCRHAVVWSVDPDGNLASMLALDFPEVLIQAIMALNDEPRICGPHLTGKTRQPDSCTSISKSPQWSSLHVPFAQHQIDSSYSYPLKDSQGKLAGILSLYGLEASSLSDTGSAHLACTISAMTLVISQQQSERQNHSLEAARIDLLDKHNLALNEANLLLRKALRQRDNVQEQLIDMENLAALGTVMSSFTHEINTPLGVVVTAASHLAQMHQATEQKLSNMRLKKSDLNQLFVEAQESCQIIQRNISRANELTKTFKQLATDQHSQTIRSMNLCAYISEVLLSLKPRIKATPHKFCIDVPTDLSIVSNPGAIGQVLINLVLNSVQHAFTDHNSGRIHIQAKIIDAADQQQSLSLVYQDNGRGMNPHTINNMYKPFFTLASSAGGNGLGMHICYNIIAKVLKGTIDCKSTLNQGVRFEMHIPLGRDGQ